VKVGDASHPNPLKGFGKETLYSQFTFISYSSLIMKVVMIRMNRRLLKNGILKECQTFDEGDPLQSASPKVLVFDYTHFVLCVM